MSKNKKSILFLPDAAWLTAATALGLFAFMLGCGGAKREAPHPLTVAQSLFSLVQMAQIGPTLSGFVPEGAGETHRISVSAKRCYAVVVVGEFPLADIEVSVSIPDKEMLAEDMMDGSIAMVQFCPERSEELELAVKAEDGKGTYRFGLFGAVTPDGDASLRLAGQEDGTCESPFLLTDGKLRKGNTARVHPSLAPKYSQADGPETIFAVDVEKTATLAITLNTWFDTVLTVTPTCGEQHGAVFLEKFPPDQSYTVNTPPLSPGRHFIIVGGIESNDMGPFTIQVRREIQPSPEEACSSSIPLLFNGMVYGSTENASTVFRGSCAYRSDAPENVYSFKVSEPSRFRVRAGESFNSLLYLRKTCTDPKSELFCVKKFVAAAVLQPEEYTLFIDGDGNINDTGKYRLMPELLPLSRVGAANDNLDNAETVFYRDRQWTSLSPDTFPANDNLNGSCGGAGSPDVVYLFHLRHKSHVDIDTNNSEYRAVYYILKREGERTVEVTCSGNFRQDYSGALDAGSYYLVIDGANEKSFGASTLNIKIRDLVEAETACKEAKTLKLGKKRSGSLADRDRFNAKTGEGRGGRDAVYKFTLAKPARVDIVLEASFDGYLYLRSGCPTGQESAQNYGYKESHGSYMEKTFRTHIKKILSPGTYFVFVDSLAEHLTSSDFTILVEKK